MEKTEKLKFAFYWAASCGGCGISVIDISEKNPYRMALVLMSSS